MIVRIDESDPALTADSPDDSLGDAPSVPDAAPRSISSWLDVMCRLLRLPPGDRSAIRDELETHLQERVRDLLLSGKTEDEAIRIAISELGETADLAHRFTSAHRVSIRRLAMTISLIGVGAVAVIAGVTAITPEAATVPTAMYEEVEEHRTPPAALKDMTLSIDAATTIEAFIAIIDDAVEETVYVRWSELADRNIEPEFPINVQLRDVAATEVLNIVADVVGDQCDEALEWRFGEHTIELGLRSSFDRREIVMVSYTIAPILWGIMEEYDTEYEDVTDQVATLIMEFVEPDYWNDNGGDLAEMKIVGGKMFVKAPKRVHGRIEWILGELRQGHQFEAANTKGRRRVGGRSAAGGSGGPGGRVGWINTRSDSGGSGGGISGGSGGSGGGGGGIGR